MCATMYRCPVCLHSSFSSVTALWQGLMSGASRRLTCPVCQEVLLGLDKLTLHLYSHLPAASVSNDTSSNSNDGYSTSDKGDGHMIADQKGKLLSDNNKITRIQEVSNIENVQQKKNQSQNFENAKEVIMSLADEVESNNTMIRHNPNTTDNKDRNELLCKVIPTPFTAIANESNPNSDSSLILESESDKQSSEKSENVLINSCSDDVNSHSNDNIPLFNLSNLDQLNVEHQLNQCAKSTDSDMCSVDENAGDVVTDISTDNNLLSSRDRNKINFVDSKTHNPDCWQESQVQCKQCGALFGKQRLLNTHMHLVHPECCALSDEERALQEYPFPCHLCSKRFKMRGSLMVHVRFVHGGARLARGAKRSINSLPFESIQQQQQQMVTNNTSAPLPNNDSPEPFFPSLTELSEQLTASPPQQTQNYGRASPTSQIPGLQTLSQHHSTLQITEVHEAENQSQSSITQQSSSQISYESQWNKADSNCERESMQVEITSQSQQWISSSIKKNIQPLSVYLNKPSNDMENSIINKYDSHKQVSNDTNITDTNTILISNFSQNEINNCNNESLKINDVLNEDVLHSQTSNKGASAIDSNKPYECEVCFKRFTTKYFHKKHQRLHTGERPYKCSTCAKTFAFQQSFHKHLLYHTSAKPHVCTECGQAFKELSTLHNHQRIHTGERPFVCETCGKAFRQRVSYLVHRRIHTGVLPYKCSACNKSFRYKVSQRTHKCPAQPPGNVVRQSELVQRLLMKASENPDHPLAAASHESAVSCSSVGAAAAQLNDNSAQKEETSSETRNSHFPPLLTINEESLHQLLSIFPN